MSDERRAVIFEEGNMRAVARWYANRDGATRGFLNWNLSSLQLEMKDKDAMGAGLWRNCGDELKPGWGSGDHAGRWLYYVLMNRAERWIKENGEPPVPIEKVSP